MTDITQRLRDWADPRYEVQTGEVPKIQADCAEAADEIDRLRAALRTLYLSAPTALDCQDFHHGKTEQHSYDTPCKPRQDYLDALAAARAALGE